MTKSRGILAPRQFWTEVELELLRRNFADSRTEDIAKALGRPYSNVAQKASRLGLKKSEAFLASPASGRLRKGQSASPDTRFKPGLTPWNKGTKGSTGVQEACRATQFRKGRRPEDAHNYKPIGSYRINGDGHVEQKVTDDQSIVSARRWKPVYRLVWEAAFGPIPDGHRIDFKPGMRTTEPAEITPDKLECISREEHMRRHTFHQYGPEVVQVVQLRGAITRQINKRTKESS